jgi:hypothetical protein
MGVDFFDCNICDKWVSDAGPYFQCGNCGIGICDSCAQENKCGKYSDEEPDTYDDGSPCYEDDSRGCPFCKLKIIMDSDLLIYTLELLNLDRKKVEEMYRDKQNAKP